MGDFCFDKLTINRIRAQAELMDRMMATLGVDAAALRRDPEAMWFAARLQCIDCPNVAVCEQWLASPEQPGAGKPADFCLNHALFSECALSANSNRPANQTCQVRAS